MKNHTLFLGKFIWTQTCKGPVSLGVLEEPADPGGRVPGGEGGSENPFVLQCLTMLNMMLASKRKGVSPYFPKRDSER